MNGDTIALICVAFVGWAGAVYNWVRFFIEQREKRAERTAKETAEAELANHRRRAQATNFIPVVETHTTVRVAGGGEIHYGDAGLLCFGVSDEVPVDYSAGLPVYLPVANLGGGWLESVVHATAGSHSIHFLAYIDATRELAGVFSYAFEPARRGTCERFTVDYIALNGTPRRDEYEMCHGRRDLRRVDPPVLTASV